jgi:UDP-N-acetylglucosamine 2-epimerase (non-hydrolysing)
MSSSQTASPHDIAVVFGTRPEIIKLAGVITELGQRARVVHTGQHYDSALSGAFFANFGLPEPQLRLDGAIGRWGRGHQVGTLIAELTREFTLDPPRAVLVQGDTNSTSAGAQAAHYCGIPVVHVEAGLRSRDRSMPEEINRQIVGVLADLHCAATPEAAGNLLAEGVPASRIRVTGNTVVEATVRSLPSPADSAALVEQYRMPAEFVLATFHRPENADDPVRLAAILESLTALGLPVMLPLHPRTRARIKEFGLSTDDGRLHLTDPVDHPTFLALASRARLLVSDSGGVQEETTILKKPLLIVRTSTERPEAVTAGFARLASPGPDLVNAARLLLADTGLIRRLAATPSPYGDGLASRRISVVATALADGLPVPDPLPATPS